MYVIKSDNGGRPYWIASGKGDPSRTLLVDNAKLFDTVEKAEKYKNKIVLDNPHRPHLKDNLKIVNLTD